MKEISLFFIFLFFNLSKKAIGQQIIIPLDPGFDEDDKEPENEGHQIIETREFKSSDGHPVRITRIHFHKGNGKNLVGNSEAMTPFQIMRIFDNKINSIFDNFIQQSFGIRRFFNSFNMDDDDEEYDEREAKKRRRQRRYKKNEDEDDTRDEVDDIFKEIEKQFNFDDDIDRKAKKIEDKEKKNNKNKENNKEIKDNNENNKKDKRVNTYEENKETKDINENKEIKEFSQNNQTREIKNINIKNRTIKKRKKLSKRELIFSRVCKYIFYSIILFTFYVLIKKLLEFLEIIDPDNVSEFKMPDEETTNLKKSEGKQN